MFNSFSLPILIPIFIVGAAAVWFAGIRLSDTTDKITAHYGIGEALGGLLFLAITTNLPEIAITASAGVTQHLGLAIGNILGGIAIQTVVLVILDIFGLGKNDSLTYRAASLALVLEAVLVVAVLGVAIMATQLPAKLIFGRITPGSLLILILWLVGLWLLSKARKDLPWQDKGRAPHREDPNGSGSSDGPEGDKKDDASGDAKGKQDATDKNKGKGKAKKDDHIGRAILVFVIASVVTLIAGIMLEESGNAIADHIGLSGVLFGATVLAATTSLPELSTGLASVKLQDYELAMSDIFGGNAFLPVLFLVADLLSGKATLTLAQNSDIYLACLGILLTTIYIYGIIFRPRAQYLRMGIDSIVVLILYIIGIGGLAAIVILH